MSETGNARASWRAVEWQQRHESAGGHRLPVNLGWLAWSALQAMAPSRGRGPLLEQLVLEEARRRGLLTVESVAELERAYAVKRGGTGQLR